MTSFLILVCLSFFAFSPIDMIEKENYTDVSNTGVSEKDLEKEVSSFNEFETSVYTSDKGTFNKRVRYWTLTKSDDLDYNLSLQKVIDRN